MGLLSTIFRFVPRDEQAGICLDESKPHWELNGKTDYPSLIIALIGLLPDGSILYLEGGAPRGELKHFLKSNSITEKAHVAYGTIWPRPLVVHMLAKVDNLRRLATLTEHCVAPELAIHFHVYIDNEVLLQWHDAFDEPLQLSKRFSGEEVDRFCKELGMTFFENPGLNRT